mmetsp:Transcript_10968/g.45596  ORF Transcript_10968/g.45596 Transcript_10968/m.45596 type:complete len:249 (+) Transcript_10968:809-1555(+)
MPKRLMARKFPHHDIAVYLSYPQLYIVIRRCQFWISNLLISNLIQILELRFPAAFLLLLFDDALLPFRCYLPEDCFTLLLFPKELCFIHLLALFHRRKLLYGFRFLRRSRGATWGWDFQLCCLKAFLGCQCSCLGPGIHLVRSQRSKLGLRDQIRLVSLAPLGNYRCYYGLICYDQLLAFPSCRCRSNCFSHLLSSLFSCRIQVHGCRRGGVVLLLCRYCAGLCLWNTIDTSACLLQDEHALGTETCF